jgi:hypothetical protein
MNLSDCKFFFAIILLGALIYGVAFSWNNWSRYPWRHRKPDPGPGYIVVPKDTPGARPIDEVKMQVERERMRNRDRD